MYEGSARNPVIGKEVSQSARSGPSESDAVTSGNVMLKPLQYQVLLLRISVPRIRKYDKQCVDHKLLFLHILCDHFATGDSVALTGPTRVQSGAPRLAAKRQRAKLPGNSALMILSEPKGLLITGWAAL